MPAYIDKMHVLMMALMMRGVASACGSAGQSCARGQLCCMLAHFSLERRKPESG
jgi:hypothetical protein